MRRAKSIFVDAAGIHPDLKVAVYSLAAQQGDSATFEKLRSLYLGTDDSQEQMKPLVAMSGFRDPIMLRRVLDYVITPEVRLQNRASVFSGVAGNPLGKKLVWPWIKSNWPAVKKMYGEGMYKMHWNNVINRLSIIADTKVGEEIRAFLAADPIPGTERAIANMLEKMAINERFLQKVRGQ